MNADEKNRKRFGKRIETRAIDQSQQQAFRAALIAATKLVSRGRLRDRNTRAKT